MSGFKGAPLPARAGRPRGLGSEESGGRGPRQVAPGVSLPQPPAGRRGAGSAGSLGGRKAARPARAGAGSWPADPGSKADDVFASGFGGAGPGWAGDVTSRSRGRHSNKQTPSPHALNALRLRPAPSRLPGELAYNRAAPRAELAAKGRLTG